MRCEFGGCQATARWQVDIDCQDDVGRALCSEHLAVSERVAAWVGLDVASYPLDSRDDSRTPFDTDEGKPWRAE